MFFVSLRLLYMQRIGGSVVEFSPATREARVQFPANACDLLFVLLLIIFLFFWGGGAARP